jgi:predicted ATPase/DNA-binding NarL/FixJ family response regulator
LSAALGLSGSQRDTFIEASRHPKARRGPRLTPEEARTLVEPAKPHDNLPLRPSSFVGRQRERSELAQRIASSPLITLVGAGGVGKTRLAIEVAATVSELFPDGVWLVGLAPLNDGDLVPQSIADVLGVQQRAGVDVATSLATWLGPKRMLLVLDNCEHVVEACAHLSSELIRTCPRLRLLATSREILGIDGETITHLDPLTVPDGPVSLAAAIESDAVRLFLDRALAASPGFRLTDQNASAAIKICQRLEGLPLAVELAAARLRTLSLEDLANRLDRRFDVLTGVRRDALPRHRSLRALVDWSYDLLNDAERVLFQQLSVFAGGWTLDAAEEICDTGDGTTLDLLSQLIDKSLVQREPQTDGVVRYRMLETLRQYAAEKLKETESGTADDVHERHAQFFADIIRRRWGAFWTGVDTAARLASVERDYDNFRASLRWLVDRADTHAAERLAASLASFWVLGVRVEEGRTWLEEVLKLPLEARVPSKLRLSLVEALAQLEALGGNLASADARLQAALPTIREYAGTTTLALALGLAASLTWRTRHDLVTARALAEEGLAVARRSGVAPIERLARGRLSHILLEGGEYDLAEQLVEGDQAFEGSHSPRGSIDLARVRFARGDYAGAASILEELIEQYATSRSALDVVLALTVLSRVRLAQGAVAPANAAAIQALRLVRENLGRTTSFAHLAAPLEALAMVAAAAGDSQRALQLAAAGASMRESCGDHPSRNEEQLLERWLEPARRALGERVSTNAWLEGRSLTAEAAIDRALSIKPRSPNGRRPALTPREREVMLLASQGLSNRQIGQALVITEGTARVHVERVLGKLELHSRAQLAAWALRHDNLGDEACLSPDASLTTRA